MQGCGLKERGACRTRNETGFWCDYHADLEVTINDLLHENANRVQMASDIYNQASMISEDIRVAARRGMSVQDLNAACEQWNKGRSAPVQTPSEQSIQGGWV